MAVEIPPLTIITVQGIMAGMIHITSINMVISTTHFTHQQEDGPYITTLMGLATTETLTTEEAWLFGDGEEIINSVSGQDTTPGTGMGIITDGTTVFMAGTVRTTTTMVITTVCGTTHSTTIGEILTHTTLTDTITGMEITSMATIGTAMVTMAEVVIPGSTIITTMAEAHTEAVRIHI